MKLFGEYLVEHNIISEEVLVEALISQIKQLPSVTEIVFEQKLLDVKDLLSVFRQQSHKHCGFIEAAMDLGYWKPEISAEVDKQAAERRIPLGELLVKQGTVKMEQITKALDEFFGEGIHLLKDAEPAIAAKPAPAAPGASVLAASQVAPAGQVAAADLSKNSSYCDLLTAAFKLRITEAFCKLANGATGKDELRTIAEELRRTKGAARLVGAEHSEKLVAKLEDLVIEINKKKISEFNSEINSKLPKVSKDIVDAIWELKDVLAGGKAESEVLATPKKQDALKELIGALDLLKFDLSFVGMDN